MHSRGTGSYTAEAQAPAEAAGDGALPHAPSGPRSRSTSRGADPAQVATTTAGAGGPVPRGASRGAAPTAQATAQAATGDGGPDPRLEPPRYIRIGAPRHNFIYSKLDAVTYNGECVYKCVRGDAETGGPDASVYYMFKHPAGEWQAGAAPAGFTMTQTEDLARVTQPKFRFRGAPGTLPYTRGSHVWDSWEVDDNGRGAWYHSGWTYETAILTEVQWRAGGGQ